MAKMVLKHSTGSPRSACCGGGLAAPGVVIHHLYHPNTTRTAHHGGSSTQQLRCGRCRGCVDMYERVTTLFHSFHTMLTCGICHEQGVDHIGLLDTACNHW